jgi:hypothetical protein
MNEVWPDMMVSAFAPRGANQTTPAGTVHGAVGTSASNIALPTGFPAVSETVARFVNSGTDTIAWAYGNATGLTATNGCVMLPNTVELFSIPGGVSSIEAIGVAGGNTLYIVPGDGN